MSSRVASVAAAVLYFSSLSRATPTPTTPGVYRRQDIFSSVVSGVENLPSEVGDVFSSIGNSVPTEAAGGIIPGLDDNLPSADDVKSKAGLNDSAIDQLPIQILNIACVAIFLTAKKTQTDMTFQRLCQLFWRFDLEPLHSRPSNKRAHVE